MCTITGRTDTFCCIITELLSDPIFGTQCIAWLMSYNCFDVSLTEQAYRRLPATEILQTFADISVTSACLNFTPRVNLTDGKINRQHYH